MTPPIDRKDLPIAIVGGGFSGTLLAINLLRYGVKVALVERDGAMLAKGLAFGTRRPEHLLNVRASNMSAFPDDAGHFVRWMGFTAGDEVNRFVPRLSYGQYLHELLVDALAKAGARAEVHQDEALGARFADDRIVLSLKSGTQLECRVLVLALGNFPPSVHPALAGLPPEVLVADPWRQRPPGDYARVEDVLLLGTGLTAIDGILSLEQAGYRGRYTALSRRGLKPHSHALSGPVVEPVTEPEYSGSRLVRHVRQRAEAIGWRGAVDELRPHTQHLWRRQTAQAQRSFLCHLRPYWDVHRHRLAPEAGERIAALEAQGRLRFVAGNLLRSEAEEGGARLTWRPRGTRGEESLKAGLVVSCTGPQGDLRRAKDPLVQDLLAQQRIRPDVHRLGLDVLHTGHVRGDDGAAQDDLFAVGPMTKGEAWEIVAVPDIRRQVLQLAQYLANAHWVGGEGL